MFCHNIANTEKFPQMCIEKTEKLGLFIGRGSIRLFVYYIVEKHE